MILKHFVRHLVDAETAIEDIISDYYRDGTRLVEQMEESHRKEHEIQRYNLAEVCTRMSSAFDHINSEIVNQEIQARSSLLGKSWEKNAWAWRRHISQLESLLGQIGRM